MTAGACRGLLLLLPLVMWTKVGKQPAHAFVVPLARTPKSVPRRAWSSRTATTVSSSVSDSVGTDPHAQHTCSSRHDDGRSHAQQQHSQQQLKYLEPSEWQSRAAAHLARITTLCGGSLNAHDPSHPIYNFLFSYYFWKPKQVGLFSPGFATVCIEARPEQMMKGGHERNPKNVTQPASSSSIGVGGRRGMVYDAATCKQSTLDGVLVFDVLQSLVSFFFGVCVLRLIVIRSHVAVFTRTAIST